MATIKEITKIRMDNKFLQRECKESKFSNKSSRITNTSILVIILGIIYHMF